MKDAPGGERRPTIEPELEPQAPQGWVRKLLLIFPAALFLFLMAVLIWGILSDLLAGY
jgi:hypothetical protein